MSFTPTTNATQNWALVQTYLAIGGISTTAAVASMMCYDSLGKCGAEKYGSNYDTLQAALKEVAGEYSYASCDTPSDLCILSTDQTNFYETYIKPLYTALSSDFIDVMNTALTNNNSTWCINQNDPIAGEPTISGADCGQKKGVVSELNSYITAKGIKIPYQMPLV
jgi:hypothetical protein